MTLYYSAQTYFAFWGVALEVTENGYELIFEFPIFIAKSAILTA